MASVGNFSRYVRPNTRKRAVEIRFILLVMLVLLSTALGLSQGDVKRFEPLWVSGYGGGRVDYSPDGSRIAVGGANVVFILDAETYAIEQRLFNYPSGWSVNGVRMAGTWLPVL